MSKLDLQHYMTSRYVNGGREWPNYDCWGLVRHAFLTIHGISLPLYQELDADDSLRKSRHHEQLTARDLATCEPQHGAIAAVVTGRVCQHVGLCVDLLGDIYVLETDEQTGPRVVTLDKYKEDYINVRYYAPA